MLALSAESLQRITLKGFRFITDESLVGHLPPTLKEFNAPGCGFDTYTVLDLQSRMTDPDFMTAMRICKICGEFDPDTSGHTKKFSNACCNDCLFTVDFP